jgi:hypothetical protein
MASSMNSSLEDLITCAICREFFEDPRILSCSHTYCCKCIKQGAVMNNDQFDCPLRDGCKISNNDIDSLPLNRTVRDFVELHSK